jgi:hypothetical protein
MACWFLTTINTHTKQETHLNCSGQSTASLLVQVSEGVLRYGRCVASGQQHGEMRHQHGLTDLGCFVTFGKTWQNISKFWRLEWLVELFHSWFPGEMIKRVPYFLHVYSRLQWQFLWEIPCSFTDPSRTCWTPGLSGYPRCGGFLLRMVAKSCTRQGNSWSDHETL